MHISVLVTFVLYFFIIFAIGLKAYFTTESQADYVLGGRRLNSLITALGVGASDMSGWLIYGLPGAVYLYGVSNVWMPIGLLIGAYLNWKLVANRLRVFTLAANNSLTIPTYLENRFQDKDHVIRIVTALVILVFFTIYSAANFKSSALLFSTTFDIDYTHALIGSVVMIVIYTSIGGFLAVNWVDVFQGVLMLFALIILPAIAFYNLDNTIAIASITKKIITETPNYFNFFDKVSTVTLISTMAWGLGYFGQPHILVRFMASRSNQAISNGRKICMSWMFLSLLGAVLTGIIGRMYYIDAPLSNSEEVFLELTQDLAPYWLIGILMAAVLSCVISTVAAQLILSSSAVVEDCYRILFEKHSDDKTLVLVGRFAVLLVAAIAFFFALDKNNSILSLVGYAWAGLGASFGPVIILSLFYRKMTSHSVVIGMVVGSVTVIAWILLRDVFPNSYILQYYEIIPGFIFSFISILLASIGSKANADGIFLQARGYMNQ